MGGTLAYSHGVDVVSVFFVDADEALQHLVLGNECLDDAQTAQRLVELRQHVAPAVLDGGRLRLQLTAYLAHNPAGQRSDDDNEYRQLPAYCQHGSKTYDDGDGLAYQHVDTAGDGVLYGSHVGRHARYDVALALLREETQRQLQHFLIHLDTDVADDTRAQWYHDG